MASFGYIIHMYELDSVKDTAGFLVARDELQSIWLHNPHPDLVILETRDSRAPVTHQAYVLALRNSLHEYDYYQPSSDDLATLQTTLVEYGLIYDEGPAHFTDTYVI